MRWASNLFHIGILAIFGGHFVGLLTPHSVFLMVMGDIEHQYLAIILGTIFGLMTLIGGGILWWRRFTNRRISASSRPSDKFVLSWLMATLILGLITIPVSIGHAGHGDPRVVTAMRNGSRALSTCTRIRLIWKVSTPSSRYTYSSA